MQAHFLKKLASGAAVLFLAAIFVPLGRAQNDPPMQAGRLSFISGTVSVQPVGLDDWGAAYPNLPIGPGDRVFTDWDGRAEIEVGRTFIRIGPNSDISFVDAGPYGLSVGVAQGSVHLHTLGLWPGQSIFVNTPSGSATLNQPGELRVDVFSDQDAALFTNLGMDAEVSGAGGFDVDLEQGQALELAGSNPVVPQWLEPAGPDNLDLWSQQRDQQIAMAASWRYVSPEIAGADELDANGNWMPGTPYGPIWFPNVAMGWAPYHYGHWVNHAPWGPVWVEDEPWGYAPFHYGRWVMFEGRWGWVPGPVAVHPVWSPALVVFGGGIQVGGVAVSAWFPLGPGEPYRPWYPCSPAYVDQVNITNIAPSPRVHVLTTYVGFNFGGVVFANRTVGVTAISQADFAAGRPVRQTNVVVNVNVIQNITIVQRPVVEVNVRAAIVRPPARPVPVVASRPALIGAHGMVVSAQPGFRPVAAPVRPAPVVHTLPGRRVVAPPPNARMQPGAAGPGAPHPGGAPPAMTARPANGQPGGQNAAQHPEAQTPQPAPRPVATPGVSTQYHPPVNEAAPPQNGNTREPEFHQQPPAGNQPPAPTVDNTKPNGKPKGQNGNTKGPEVQQQPPAPNQPPGPTNENTKPNGKPKGQHGGNPDDNKNKDDKNKDDRDHNP